MKNNRRLRGFQSRFAGGELKVVLYIICFSCFWLCWFPRVLVVAFLGEGSSVGLFMRAVVCAHLN